MDNTMPTVVGYPVCSECKTAYVLRRTYVLAFKKGEKSGDRWLWQRDCKHKKAAPVIVEEKKKRGARATEVAHHPV